MKDEAKLIRESAAGDSQAFEVLVQQHQDRLFRSMVHITGSQHEAEDVVQEAFVRAFFNLEKFNGQSAFYTWLYRIALNRARSQQKRRKPVLLEQTHPVEDELLDKGDAPHTRLDRQERAAQIQQALEKLSQEYREVIVLREVDGYNYESIAGILDISVGTVRSRLHRARSQLREILARLG